MAQHIPVAAPDAEWLQSEVARLEEALEAMSGDLLRVLHERDQVTQQRDTLRMDLVLAETERAELFQQRGDEMLRADLWKDRAEESQAEVHTLRQALGTALSWWMPREERERPVWGELKSLLDGKEPAP